MLAAICGSVAANSATQRESSDPFEDEQALAFEQEEEDSLLDLITAFGQKPAKKEDTNVKAPPSVSERGPSRKR